MTDSLPKGWRPAAEEGNPLACLQGRPLASGTLEVLLGPTHRYGARYFQLLLGDRHGHLGQPPLLLGLHHHGPYPSYNWIEVIQYNSVVAFASGSTLRLDCQAERQLFRYLGGLIPPGGHLMVEYDTTRWRQTERALVAGVAPEDTELGRLLADAGCGASYKDWYFSEGGAEGPRKLQGRKALPPM
ncbi:MAG: DUF1122 family protein [Dehalococcoidia bacterium]